MKTSRITTLALGAACLAMGMAAHASGQMTEQTHITNGGTGYIGLTESAGQPRARMHAMNASRADALPAGEASTLVNGRPNVEPNAPDRMTSWSGSTRDGMGDTRSMGARAAMGAAPMNNAAGSMGHPAMWGTPD